MAEMCWTGKLSEELKGVFGYALAHKAGATGGRGQCGKRIYNYNTIGGEGNVDQQMVLLYMHCKFMHYDLNHVSNFMRSYMSFSRSCVRAIISQLLNICIVKTLFYPINSGK